jgi:hypothetical protein
LQATVMAAVPRSLQGVETEATPVMREGSEDVEQHADHPPASACTDAFVLFILLCPPHQQATIKYGSAAVLALIGHTSNNVRASPWMHAKPDGLSVHSGLIPQVAVALPNQPLAVSQVRASWPL